MCFSCEQWRSHRVVVEAGGGGPLREPVVSQEDDRGPGKWIGNTGRVGKKRDSRLPLRSWPVGTILMTLAKEFQREPCRGLREDLVKSRSAGKNLTFGKMASVRRRVDSTSLLDTPWVKTNGEILRNMTATTTTTYSICGVLALSLSFSAKPCEVSGTISLILWRKKSRLRVVK